MDSHVRVHQESLVHPTMLVHPNPVNVAVIGGADGSTIREILKHQSVQSVFMIEKDDVLVEISRKHLSSMSDCSDIIGVKEDCFDDDRVHLIHDDPVAWFVNNFGVNDPSKLMDHHQVNGFDVVIFHTLEPKNQQDIFNNKDFLDAVMNSLSDDGLLATQLGPSHTIYNPRAEYSHYATRERFMQLLEQNDQTGAMFVYEESHIGLENSIAYLTVCRNVNCRASWYADALVVDYHLSVRMRETKSKQPVLIHYDGTTHQLFQIPPRAWEDVYCRRNPEPAECKFRSLDLSKEIFDIDIENEQGSSFKIEALHDDVTGKKTKAIYATVDIPAGSYIMPTDLAGSFSISEYTHNSLKSITQMKGIGDMNVIKKFLQFIEYNGHKSLSDGNSIRYVEAGATFMIRKSSKMDEVNIGRWIPEHLRCAKQPVYSPVYDRKLMTFDLFLVATKDIKKGEELVKPTNLWSN